MRRKIFRMGHQKLLIRNTHGKVRIYESTNQINYNQHYFTVQVKWPIISRWMDLHKNHTRNVWITTSGNSCIKLTCTTFAQPWILKNQTHTRIIDTCLDTYLIHIGSGWFWDCSCLTREIRSSDECTENELWKHHNRLGGEIIVWYNNEMGLS